MYPALVLVPIAFFVFLACVVLIPAWLRHRLRMAAVRVISDALAQSRAADVALIEKLLMPPPAAVGKWFMLVMLFLGVGALSIGVALGLGSALAGVDPAQQAGTRVGSLVNGCIGAGLISLGVISWWRFSGLKRPAPRWDYAAVLALICLFLGTSGLSIGAGLALSGLFYPDLQRPATSAGFFFAALVNGCTGLGFTVLGSFILWAFTDRREA